MTLGFAELAHFLLALGMLLAAAHGFGYAMARIGQPRVIGEILGGLILGPTLLGALAPGLQASLFPTEGTLPLLFDAIYQLGLLLLMFCAGAEVRGFLHSGERRSIASISVVGLLVPFSAGLLAVRVVDLRGLHGPSATDAAFLIVFGVAIAITSIPVISRIMFDLGVLESPFARIVLGVAVVEDVALYVLLAIALGLVAQNPQEVWGLPSALGIAPGGASSVAYHVAAELVFLIAFITAGPWAYRVLLRRLHPVTRGTPIAAQLVFMLGMSALAMWLGVAPLFGAFVAGIVVAKSTGLRAARAREHITAFSFAFFIPLYFAIVGFRLDLLTQFSLRFFVPFFLFACLVKSLSVYVGARLGGENPDSSRNLAIALNARGGPGIVLASVALDAGIVDPRFYSALVMLAILTSLLAGSWLSRIVRSGRPLRGVASVVEAEDDRQIAQAS